MKQGNGVVEDKEIYNAEHMILRSKKYMALLERDALDISIGKKQRKQRK
jgi:hypothetical protein